jgi:hypothetical protein
MIDRPNVEELDELPATRADEHGSAGGGHSTITGRACWLHVMDHSSVPMSIHRALDKKRASQQGEGAFAANVYLGGLPKLRSASSEICSDYRSQRVRYDDQ